MDYFCFSMLSTTCFVFACSSIQTKLCVLLLVLMTHAIDDLPANPETAQTFQFPIETVDNNGLTEADPPENENPGPLSSENNEEKLVTVVKKVEEIFLFGANY